MFTNATLKAIFERTSGHCHFCGDPLIFKNYASKRDGELSGAWEVDHVIQKGKGGRRTADNCLPTCVRCNRLRWHRHGDDLREIIFLGLIAKDEIKKSTEVGRRLLLLKQKRERSNTKRRRNVA
jgi:5-methylcytosine-specific restriction endonuclease McrA